MMIAKIFLSVLLAIGAFTCATNAAGSLEMEMNNLADRHVQNTFFHHHFPPYNGGAGHLGFGGGFGGAKGPGLGGIGTGFGAGGNAEHLGGRLGYGAVAGGGLGSGFADLGVGDGFRGGGGGMAGGNHEAGGGGGSDGGLH